MVINSNRLLLLTIIIVQSLSFARYYEQRTLPKPMGIQPTTGEPWPKPQSIQTTSQRLGVHPDTFHFLISETSQRCDLLTNAFARYHRAIFFPRTYLSHILSSSFPVLNDNHVNQARSYASSRKEPSTPPNASLLMDLYVNVEQPCEQWPSLESNESCISIFDLDNFK